MHARAHFILRRDFSKAQTGVSGKRTAYFHSNASIEKCRLFRDGGLGLDIKQRRRRWTASITRSGLGSVELLQRSKGKAEGLQITYWHGTLWAPVHRPG